MTARRRFYKTVTVTDDNGVALDGRVVKTPMKAPLRLPNRALAEAVAAEWEAQGEKIMPSTMYFTKLANTAIDRVGAHRAEILAELLEYAGSDLVCYRADRPEALVARQAEHWNPVVDWARTVLDAPMEVTVGVIHTPQPETALKAIASALTELDDFQVAAFHGVMTIGGSALVALMVARGVMSAEAAWETCHVDEDYQIAIWGEDEEAAERRARRYVEFMACCRVLELSRA